METGGDPAQVKDVVQNLALETSIKGGDTQQVIDNIEAEVAKPDDSVSKSLSSLATQEKQGKDEAVNTAIDKVAEGVVSGNDVAKVVTTAVEDGGTVEGGLTTTTEGTTTDGTTTDGTTTDGTTPLDGGTAGAAFDEVVKSVENPETVDGTEQQSSLS